MKKRIQFLVVAASLLLCTSAFAHEFILKPVQMQVEPGNRLPFSVVSSHVFMVSEEMEPVGETEVSLVEKNAKTPLVLRENEVLMTLDGVAEPKNGGNFILAGHRKGLLWTQTTLGWKQAGKKDLTGVISSGKYEKFCKTLVCSGKPDDTYKTVIGQKLEIVPLSDPAATVPGKEIKIKVLYDGKPLSTKVYATYDGFSNHPGTYAYFTETDADGVAPVKITHPGLWMVRVEHKISEPTEDYDDYNLRSVLVFGIE